MTDAPFTGFSATLGQSATVPSRSGSIPKLGLTQQDYHIASALRRVGAKKLKRLLNTLTGSAIGSQATETRAQVQGVNTTFTLGEFGGVRPVVSNTIIDRPTTQADVDNINAILTRSRPPISIIRPYNEHPTSYTGDRVISNYDDVLGSDINDLTVFILGKSLMVRRP